MKKLALVGAVASVFSVGFVSAADVVVSTEGAEEVAVPSFDGAYFGLGLGGSFLETKVEAIVNGKTVYSKKAKCNRFIGTVVFGGGKALKGKFYVGAEGLIDFAKSSNKDIFDNGEKNGSVKSRGIVPGVGLRFGYVNNCCMVYLKPALLFPKTTIGKEISVSKAAYSIALGAEKSFCKKFTARLEGEYVFGSKKNIKDDGAVEAKLTCNKGFNIRALCSYNIKFR